MSEHNQKFDSEVEWINKAQSWLTRHPRYGQFFKAICFDSTGMICLNGGHFAKAAYPVYWVWPDQNLFERVKEVVNRTDSFLQHSNPKKESCDEIAFNIFHKYLHKTNLILESHLSFKKDISKAIAKERAEKEELQKRVDVCKYHYTEDYVSKLQSKLEEHKLTLDNAHEGIELLANRVDELELALYRINQCSLEPDKILCIYERAVNLKRREEIRRLERSK